jgi:sugar phosphate isomerase/epimerase
MLTSQPPPISVQLYSLREVAQHDFAPVLTRLGKAGFVGVELAGFNNLTPAEFGEVAADAGLVVSSAHVSAGPDFAQTVETMQSLGCNTLVIPYLPAEHFADLDAIKRSADLINEANIVARASGASVGYHNHWWEFETVIGGRSAFSHLYDHLSDDVFVELDTYWTKVGGADPVQVITAFGDRVRLLHVKDGPADEYASDMVAVGRGTMPVANILAAATHADWHVVELDRCGTDMFEAVEDSYRFLVGNGFSRGRS